MRKQPSYRQLRDLWYKKLKEDGFEDIETKSGMLKGGSSTYEFTRERAYQQQGGFEAKIAYYDMATKFLNEYKFTKRLDKIIWEYHVNAISVRNISKLLRAAKVSKIDYNTVCRRIQKYREIMKKLYIPGYGK